MGSAANAVGVTSQGNSQNLFQNMAIKNAGKQQVKGANQQKANSWHGK